MNDIIRVLIVMFIIIIFGIILFIITTLTIEKKESIETSNCEQLLQIIKDRRVIPHGDRILNKWIQMECWK